jgi:hypothetical protein
MYQTLFHFGSCFVQDFARLVIHEYGYATVSEASEADLMNMGE